MACATKDSGYRLQLLPDTVRLHGRQRIGREVERSDQRLQLLRRIRHDDTRSGARLGFLVGGEPAIQRTSLSPIQHLDQGQRHALVDTKRANEALPVSVRLIRILDAQQLDQPSLFATGRI
ncbi:hypothetical protein WM23_22375 [Burkholderia ubonensis]|nr:hypothetical protein WM23_22375 [Burkholderia ubonensis]